jgi:outer membrane protein assembly factor BamB
MKPPPDAANPLPAPSASPADNSRWPIRLWPGWLIVVVAVLLYVVSKQLRPLSMYYFISVLVATIIGSLATVVWWLVAARARGRDRWLFPALYLLPAIPFGATLRGDVFFIAILMFAMPALALVWVLWLTTTATLDRGIRRIGLMAVLLGGWLVIGMIRFEGVGGNFAPELLWRWQDSAETRFLTELGTRKATVADTSPVVAGPGDWPAFRGVNRDDRLAGVTIGTDWTSKPPRLLWKHRVGPGWGSFSSAGGRLFTQEQRGADEAVVCYAADTGDEQWAHQYPARFEETSSGAGPRATPTISDGKVHAQGATGMLFCLDGATGRVIWKTDLTASAKGVMPQWGFAGSPLVTQGLVIVYAGGPDKHGMAAFKADTGELAWSAGQASHTYSSAQLATLGGVEQVLLLSDYGLESFQAADGAILWEHAWRAQLNRVTQPTVLSDSDVLITTGTGNVQGTRRLHITKNADNWEVQMVWNSANVRPYYNDGVVYDGHLYGYDDYRLCCVDLATGSRLWTAGQYGHGQVLLLADQGVLLVQAEKGSVALVKADPAGPSELTRFQALEGKTWNHPVIARGRLFVRNGQEAACYELPARAQGR